MDIQIIEHIKETLSVVIQCNKIDDEVMRLKSHIESEEILSDKDFVRISKSLIVNINKIRSLKPELNRTILVTLCNGELLYISRKYVPFVRKLLSI